MGGRGRRVLQSRSRRGGTPQEAGRGRRVLPTKTPFGRADLRGQAQDQKGTRHCLGGTKSQGGQVRPEEKRRKVNRRQEFRSRRAQDPEEGEEKSQEGRPDFRRETGQ